MRDSVFASGEYASNNSGWFADSDFYDLPSIRAGFPAIGGACRNVRVTTAPEPIYRIFTNSDTGRIVEFSAECRGAFLMEGPDQPGAGLHVFIIGSDGTGPHEYPYLKGGVGW
jgi:hypothetical protein